MIFDNIYAIANTSTVQNLLNNPNITTLLSKEYNKFKNFVILVTFLI